MVRRLGIALAVVAAASSLAGARPPPPDHDDSYEIVEDEDDDPPAFNMFGFDIVIGRLPFDGEGALALSLGLSVEHPVFRKTRVFGEYDWLWLTRHDERATTAVAPRPEQHASGHRASLGLRRELAAKELRALRLFVDGEIGANAALVNDNMSGVQLVPGVFTGVRAGYDLYSRSDDSPSRTFETAILVRAIGVRGGVGFTFGVGMFWGN